jgi:hypothetical protein
LTGFTDADSHAIRQSEVPVSSLQKLMVVNVDTCWIATFFGEQ